MRLNTIKYYFVSAFESIFKNSLMSIASIVTVASCISILLLSFSIANNISHLLLQMENSIGFNVFLSDSMTSLEGLELKKEIEQLNYVVKVVFISKEDALKEMGEWMEGNSELLEGLENDNPLLMNLEIYLENPKYQSQVLEKIDNLKISYPGIEKINSMNIEPVLKINNIVTIVSSVVIGFMGIISIVIIMNTIKLTVNSREKEINIMKYVGATDWFIRWPFVIEGIIIGIVGALIPTISGYFLYNKGIEVISQEVPIINMFGTLKSSIDIFRFIGPIALGTGVLIGTVGSLFSMRKYLKV